MIILSISNLPIWNELTTHTPQLKDQLPGPPNRIKSVGVLPACLFISLLFSQLQETHGRVISLLTNYWECTVAREKDEAEGKLAELTQGKGNVCWRVEELGRRNCKLEKGEYDRNDRVARGVEPHVCRSNTWD